MCKSSEINNTQNDFESKYLEWSLYLQRGRNECIKILDRAFLKKEDSKKFSKKEFSHLLSVIIKKAGTYLGYFLYNIWDYEGIPRKNRCFYIWPGYYSYSPYQGRRTDAADQEDDIDALNTKKLSKLRNKIIQSSKNHGFGMYWKTSRFNDGENIFVFPLSIWFFLFYGKKIGDNEVYGFTKWFKDNGPLYVKNNNRTIFPLSTIEITTDKKRKKDKYFFHKGFLSIYLQKQKGTNAVNLLDDFKKSLNEITFYKIKDNKKEAIHKISYTRYKAEEYPSYSIVPEDNEHVKKALISAFSFLWHSIFYGHTGNINYKIKEGKETQDEIVNESIISINNEVKNAVKLFELFQKNNRYKNIHFENYYVFPINTGFSIKNSEIEINDFLGTMNLYTMHAIKPIYLNMIKKFLDSIYDQVRLIDVTISVEKSGIKKGQSTSSGAFAHEIKHVAEAMLENWCLSLEDLFDIKFTTKMTDGLDKIGYLELYNKDIDNFGIFPIKSMLQNTSNLIKLWCLRTDNEDLPFDERPENFKEFIQCTFKSTIEFLIIHLVSHHDPNNYTKILETENIIKILREVLQSIDLRINDNDEKIDWSKNSQMVWVGRVFTSSFMNFFIHGDISEGLDVDLSSTLKENNISLYECRLKDKPKSDSTNIKQWLLKNYNNTELDIIMKYLDKINTRVETAYSENFTGREVMELCLTKLNGNIDEYWIHNSDYTISIFKFHFQY